jgi:hypothetical protein
VDARGWTDVIIASIGLSMDVLNQNLFATIVTVVTTMPPTLCCALGRLPTSPEEAARLEREEFEAKGLCAQYRTATRSGGCSPGRTIRFAAGRSPSRRIQREIVRLRSRSVVTICGKPAVRSPAVLRSGSGGTARTGGMLGPLRRE